MIITIDNYYTEGFYNTCKEAMKNNSIEFFEYISTIGNFKWYLDIPQKPVMVNYDTLPTGEYRYLVSKVIPLDYYDEYKYYRRADSKGSFSEKYITNDFMEDIRNKEAYLFKVKTKNDLENLSKIEGAKIWYLGRYYGGRFKMALTTSIAVRMYISTPDILLEKPKEMTNKEFELNINYKVLHNKEKLIKFAKTPYFENGKINLPLYYPEKYKTRFLVV